MNRLKHFLFALLHAFLLTASQDKGCMGKNAGCTNIAEGDGDCDSDGDCGLGLTCGTDNCGKFRSSAGWPTNTNGWDKTDDCCEAVVCKDVPLPAGAPYKTCTDVKAAGLCEDSQKAEWFCSKTCDLCESGNGDQCEHHGKKFKHGFHACYDECHKSCEGKKWICWHGKWYAKGACGSKNGDQCIGDNGRPYDDGYHACYDKCYPSCKGNQWICKHGDWVPRGKCADGADSAYEWSTFRGSSYIRLSSMPQTETKNACKVLGAAPVQISDADENAFVQQVCSNYGPCWIGMAELPHSEQWRWMVDGTPPNFLNWADGEPNNWGHVDENAAIMSYPPGSSNGKWFDAPSSWGKPVAICERSQNLAQASRMVNETPSGGNPLPPFVWMLLGAVLALTLLACVWVYRGSKQRKHLARDEVEHRTNLNDGLE